MSDIKGILLAALLVVPVLQAEEQLHTLSGSCSVTAATHPTEADLRLERGGCEGFQVLKRSAHHGDVRSSNDASKIRERFLVNLIVG